MYEANSHCCYIVHFTSSIILVVGSTESGISHGTPVPPENYLVNIQRLSFNHKIRHTPAGRIELTISLLDPQTRQIASNKPLPVIHRAMDLRPETVPRVYN
jgi:hypothetical protein